MRTALFEPRVIYLEVMAGSEAPPNLKLLLIGNSSFVQYMYSEDARAHRARRTVSASLLC